MKTEVELDTLLKKEKEALTIYLHNFSRLDFSQAPKKQVEDKASDALVRNISSYSLARSVLLLVTCLRYSLALRFSSIYGKVLFRLKDS